MRRETFRLEGGPYHGTTQNVKVERGEPPRWLHMVDPIGSYGDGPNFAVCAHSLEAGAVGVENTMAIYERRSRSAHAPRGQVWYYLHWTPPEASVPSGSPDKLHSQPG